MKEENIKSEYQRKVDKSLIPTCNIMGVNIAAINMNWLLKYIDENLSDIKGDYICVSNVHAKYICTDSFHCTVFSILHHKQFLAFDRYSDPLMMSRNSRIANLCDITGLSSRRYNGDVLEQMKKPIDYDRVDERLEKEKAISVAYIREALGKND